MSDISCFIRSTYILYTSSQVTNSLPYKNKHVRQTRPHLTCELQSPIPFSARKLDTLIYRNSLSSNPHTICR